MNRVDTLRTQTNGRPKPAPEIIVFGSCFLDYLAYAASIPKPGQTIRSEAYAKGFGGKGANQAVMAARLGAKVAMVAAVGADADGDAYVDNFRQQGVDTTYVKRVPNQSTGLAMICVNTSTAENAITICPNAADTTTVELLPVALLQQAKLLVCQNEVPLNATLAALRTAHGLGVQTVFNTAPAPSPSDVERLRPYMPYIDVLCPNEHEAALMTGLSVTDFPSAVVAGEKLRELGAGSVVITLGSNGAAVIAPNTKPVHAAVGEKVKAVDTTGAGDAFVGAMAYFLSHGDSLAAAVQKANVCAGQSVTRRGTQASYPSSADLPAALFQF